MFICQHKAKLKFIIRIYGKNSGDNHKSQGAKNLI